jgi:alanine-glyoxylate transaminase/(R)-3-amino-2-methylpropionate-pyruvate transaminase
MYPGVFHVYPNNLEQLEQLLRFGTGGNVSSFIVEPLQGFGGIHPLSDGYMKEAFRMIRDAGGLCISDEV